jgi:glycerophosphoryl diester phosphodiesterase
MRHPYFDLPGPLVIGHRGAKAHRPENTLVSFEHALQLGAQILESDVHATREGVPVLIHDDRVDRTTDGAGAVRDLTLEELRRLDAGSRYTPDGGRSHPWRGRGVCIPTLEEAFEAFPAARFNLELKEDETGFVERVVETVARHGREDRTLLTAGEDAIMRHLREHMARTGSKAALGAASGDVLGFVRTALEGGAPPPEPMALQIPADFGGRPLVTPALVRHAHAHDVQVHVWTINEPAEMEALLDLGVDGIVTDYPERMAEIARRRARRP